MKKYLISGAIIGGLCVYFFMTLVVLPQEYLSHKIIEPQPTQAVTLSNDEITLGVFFIIEIEIENKHGMSDILVTSAAFPGVSIVIHPVAPSPSKTYIDFILPVFLSITLTLVCCIITSSE